MNLNDQVRQVCLVYLFRFIKYSKAYIQKIVKQYSNMKNQQRMMEAEEISSMEYFLTNYFILYKKW